MNIAIKDIITLSDNKEYVVANKTVYDNNRYYCLVDIENINNIKFCLETKDNLLIEVEDKKTLQILIMKFFKEMK